ncbi:MAG: hypothetical protein Q4G48_08540 [Bacteroidia bacterium]|nr:hypothetical protein [Bacteroidia bacterium]
MAKTTGKTLTRLLQDSEVALTNAEANPEIKTALETVSYGTEKIAEGKALRQKVASQSDTQLKEFVESTDASHRFKAAMKQVKETYSGHRKRAKLAFEDDSTALYDLALLGKQSKVNSVWVDMVTKFYATLLDNEAYLATIAGMGVTREDVEAAQALIDPLNEAYTVFVREKGESEEATRAKEQAQRDLELYMNRFWKAARIALEDKPQLMESLKKTVK